LNKRPITLGINTTTRFCSVALLVGDKKYEAQEYSERGHEGIVLTLMDDLLAQADIGKKDIELLAFGRGPGAFTGIRVATATTQGLAVGLGIPVVPVSDLLNIAYQHNQSSNERRIASCVDARMHEIYCGIIEFSESSYVYIQEEKLQSPKNWNNEFESEFVGVGNGFSEFPELIEQLNINIKQSNFELVPTALAAAELAREEYASGKAVVAAEALPVYLRNEVAWK